MYIVIERNRSKMSKSVERDQGLDAIHGLLVLYMMLMHLLGFAIGSESKFYYPLTHLLSFFMAWFFFKAGMFYKHTPVSEGLKRSSRRLLVPAVIYSLIGFLLYAILNHFRLDWYSELRTFFYSGALRGNNPMWFLFSLFLVQMLYNMIRHLRINPWVIPILSGALYITALYGHVESVFLVNVPLGLFFYSMGYVLAERQYKSYCWVPAIILYVVLGLLPSVSDFRRGYYDPLWLGFLWSLVSCVAINGLFRRLPCLCIKPLRFIGLNAMSYYGTHWMVILTSQAICAWLSLGRSSAIICYFTLFGIYLLIFTIIISHWNSIISRCVIHSVQEK